MWGCGLAVARRGIVSAVGLLVWCGFGGEEMSKPSALERVVASLLSADRKGYRKLSRGLVISYTPQHEDGRTVPVARLVWSRRDVHPSDIEDNILQTAVRNALRAVNNRVVVSGPMFRMGLTLKRDWGSSFMEWRWVPTSDLNGLVGNDRACAMEWIHGR